MRAITGHFVVCCALVFCLATATTSNAEPAATKVIVPKTTRFPDKFTPPVYYPVIAPKWHEAPLVSKELFGLDHPSMAHRENVELQRVLLEDRDNPIVRAHTVSLLSSCNNKAAIGVLKKRLKGETEVNVIADILKGLARYEVRDGAKHIAPYLNHNNRAVRYRAIKLYSEQTQCSVQTLLKRVKVETDLNNQHALWSGIVGHAAKTKLADWKPLWTHADPEFQAYGVAGALAAPGVASSLDTLLKIAQSGPVDVRFAIAAALHPGLPAAVQAPLVKRLVKDAHASIRAETADAIGRLKNDQLLPELLGLAKDSSDNVRLHASKNLVHFPTLKSCEALIVLTGDKKSAWVREEAFQMLVRMAKSFDVESRIGQEIDNRNPLIRFHTFRVLDRLQSRKFADPLRKRYGKEKTPDNLAALIRASVAAGDQKATAKIMAVVGHDAAVVRAAVAHAIGRLDIAKGYEQIERYVDDTERVVRCAALEAMGRIGDARFGDSLLRVLKATRPTPDNLLGAPERVVAGWSSGRVAAPSDGLLGRLADQILKPVIPNPMGPPSHDSEIVRVSCCWALTEQARRDPDSGAAGRAKFIIEILQLDSSDQRIQNMQMPLSRYLNHYAYQAERYLRDEPVTLDELDIIQFRFNYRKLKKR